MKVLNGFYRVFIGSVENDIVQASSMLEAAKISASKRGYELGAVVIEYDDYLSVVTKVVPGDWFFAEKSAELIFVKPLSYEE